MKIPLTFALLCLFGSVGFAQQPDSIIVKEVVEFREELNADFKDPGESPLTEEDFADFSSLDFFPIDLTYHINARFIRTSDQKPFKMATTTERSPVYEKYGEAHFTLKGQNIALNIYQSHELRETEEYRDYLFLPFTDETNGEETYGGGRYLELWIPEADTITVDFNKAYNPYCVYNYKYSCPLVPDNNHIPLKINAGVKDYNK
ncbi:MAG: DUF1684 domain-containing protein [Balneolaceae bacterium]